jgi:hypothetical protein
MVASDQRPNGLDADIRGQDEDADRDHLLRSLIRGWRLQASPGEEPHNNEPGGRRWAFNQSRFVRGVATASSSHAKK